MGGNEGRNVLVAFHEEVVGGATLSVLRLVPALSARGWRFAFWVPKPGELHDQLRERGLEVYGMDRHLAYSWRALSVHPGPAVRLASLPRYFAALGRLIRKARPAIFHANSLFTLPEAVLARSLGVPTVCHFHEMVRPGWKGKAARRVAFAVGTEVIAVSRACAASIALSGSRPRVIYEGTEVPAEVAPPDGGARRMIVGTVGVISRRKGSDLFVEAARLVRERTDEVEFGMIGAPTDPLDEGWARKVLGRARQVGITHQLRGDVPAAMRAWDLFVLPSRWDPFPISVLEAMAAGLPVVGTRVDGIPEQVVSTTGILVRPESPADLAEAILQLHRSPSRREQMGVAARRRVVENFTLGRQAEGIHEAYLAALGKD